MAHIYTELFLLISILASQHGLALVGVCAHNRVNCYKVCGMMGKVKAISLLPQNINRSVESIANFNLLGSTIRIEIDQNSTGKMENEVTVSCLEDESPHTVLKPIIMEVGRQGERPLATVNQGSHVSLMDGMKNNYNAEGYLGQGKMSNFLRLKIINPSLNDTGEYNCIFFYLDVEGKMEKHIASANLTVEKLDTMRIIDFLMDKVSLLENKVHGQTKTISQQEKKLNDQERRLQNQLDDQQKQAIRNSNEVFNTFAEIKNEFIQYTTNQSRDINERVSNTVAEIKNEFIQYTTNQSQIINERVSSTVADIKDECMQYTTNQSVVINQRVNTRLKDVEAMAGNQSVTIRDLDQKVNTRLNDVEATTGNQSITIRDLDQKVSNVHEKVKNLELTTTKQGLASADLKKKVSNTVADIKDECMQYTTNQSVVINQRVSDVLKKVEHLKSITSNQGLVVADLKKKDTMISAFAAGYSTIHKISDGAVMVFDTKMMDIGGHYNNNNGLYTAPVDGIYVFHLVVTTVYKDELLKVKIMANNKNVAEVFAYEKSSFDQSSNNAVVHLAKGQVVKAVVSTTSGRDYAWDYPYTVFSGYLLKEL